VKTVLVTTSWLGTAEYVSKLHNWLEYYTLGMISLDLKYDTVVVLDNASPFEKLKEFGKGYSRYPGVVFQRFPQHFGRPSHYDYPYLWRAVDFYAELFKEYDKIVYMDNDFYVLSPKMVDWINNIQSGWTSPWCIRHDFPETGLQIITKTCAKYNNLHPFSVNNGQCMEHVLPVQVDKTLTGDRHSEYGLTEQQPEWDFSAQVLPTMKMRYKS
jgi:hypothetical protein